MNILLLEMYHTFHSSLEWNESHSDGDSNLLIKSLLCQAVADVPRVKITIWPFFHHSFLWPFNCVSTAQPLAKLSVLLVLVDFFSLLLIWHFVKWLRIPDNDVIVLGNYTLLLMLTLMLCVLYFSIPMRAMTSATCPWICLWFGTGSLSLTTPTTSKVS